MFRKTLLHCIVLYERVVEWLLVTSASRRLFDLDAVVGVRRRRRKPALRSTSRHVHQQRSYSGE